MIHTIFFPDKIGNYYIFGKRILGIEIGKSHIHATLIRASGNIITIERCFQEKIENTAAGHEERIVEALKKIIAAAGKVHEIKTCISSTLAVFKELKLPFTSYDKIRMIVHFEVEPLLPFPIQDATIDFLIMQEKAEAGSEVLVVAVQKSHITHQLALCAQAEISPKVITVDLVALYQLFLQIPAYADAAQNHIFIDMGMHATRIASVVNKQLKQIRALPTGISHIVKAAADTLKSTPADVMNQLLRTGLGAGSSPEYTDTITKAFNELWKEIRFTIDSFAINSGNALNILLLGDGATIKDIAQVAHAALTMPTQLFDPTKITETKHFVLSKKLQSIPLENSVSTAIAIPAPGEHEFNLRKGEFDTTDTSLFIKQFIVGISLIVLLFLLLIGHIFIQSRRLRNEANASKQEALIALKEQFPSIDQDENDLEEAVTQAQDELRRQEDLWSKFSPMHRPSYLKTLLELTERIDKDSLGFSIENMTITDAEVGIKGQVRDYDALKLLERELSQSKMLSILPPAPQEPSFVMKLRQKTSRGS